MNKSKLSNSILKKIEQEKITPRSRAYFVAKNLGFWGVFALAMLAGAVSVALILYAANNTDFAVAEFVEETELIEHWFALLPLVWILLVGVAIGIGIVGLKHTKRGYRIALFTLIGSNVLGSVLLGSGLYAAGGGEMIEEVVEEYVAPYDSVREKHLRFWGNPEKTGRLAGRVRSVDQDHQTMTLEGPYGRTWTVPFDPENLPQNQPLEPGRIIKMRGKIEDADHFRPRGMEPAQRMEHLQEKIEDHLNRHPELRRHFEQKLEPETREQLEILKENGQRPSPELREQMRQEVEANTTETERKQMRETIRESIHKESPEALPRLRGTNEEPRFPEAQKERWQESRQEANQARPDLQDAERFRVVEREFQQDLPREDR